MNRLVAIFLCLTAMSVLASGQEQSVKPGINDTFRDPDPKQFVERFEIESREVFHHREEILKACQIRPGMIVADIGAGTGLFTRLFSKAVGPTGRVVAVDLSPKFLDHIRATSQQQNLTNVETVLCTADSTELPANSIDVAFICDTYHHFEYPQKTMTSLYRALKPGGRVILVDYRRIEGESSDWVLNHVRAGQSVVEDEVRKCSFRKTKERSLPLKENYFVEFQTIPLPQELRTSLLPGVGGIAELTGAPESPRPGGRIVFDVTQPTKPGEVNAGLERAARVLNLYGAAGLKPGDVQIAIVLHGDAAQAAVTEVNSTDPAVQKNPNLELIAALNHAGVDVFVCGQTLARKKIPQSVISEGVIVATSAMTALMNHQADGYSLMRVD